MTSLSIRHSPPPLATRLERLGTETAYDISAEAQALAVNGTKLYNFHIGDENFGTPESVVQSCEVALEAGLTTYSPAAGEAEVRSAIANHVNRERAILERYHYDANNVLVQPGGKPVIFKFLLATMNPGDAVAFPSPGYPIYESLIRFLGGVPRPYTFRRSNDDDGALALDMESLERAITGDQNHGIPSAAAKCLIWNDLHNPTGYCATKQEHQAVAKLAVKHNMWVLSDEAYFHIVYSPEDRGRSIVQQDGMRERTVLLLTCSKTWAMTGWRVGAAVGPETIIETMVKIATNDEGCTNHFVQLGALTAFQDNKSAVHNSLQILAELELRRDLLVSLLADVPGFNVPGGVPPKSTFYLWVDVTDAFDMLGLNTSGNKDSSEMEKDYETFRKQILHNTGVSFCTRVHFGAPLPGEGRRYVRFAFSGIDKDDMRNGIAALKEYMDSHVDRVVPSGQRAAAVAAAGDSSQQLRFPRKLQLGRKPRVFCTRQMPKDAFEILNGMIDIEVWEGYDAPPRDALLEKIKDCDGLISLLTDEIDEELLAVAPKLQVVSQLAVGYNNIDVDACTRRGVRVSNTPGVLTETVVESALALIVACGRRVIEADHYVRSGNWKTGWHPLMLLGSDLHGATLGVVGLGRIGGKLARVAKEIGADVIYYDVDQNAALEAEGIVKRVDTLDELCQQSDAISIHVNLTPETHHMFDATMLAKCKPNCIIVNTARGPVIDQQALARALQNKTIAAAGLDVFEQEPIPADDPILQCDNAVLFPHLGSASTATRADMSRLVGENMLAYWKGEPMAQLVNFDVEKLSLVEDDE